jgi:hypothetical protein
MAVYYLNRKGELVLSLFAKEPRVRRRDRPRCGAKTRRGTRCRAPAVWDRGKDQARNGALPTARRLEHGKPCRAPAVWDREEDRARNGRCRLHGGLSTGPRTTAGRDAIRASNKRRAFRENAGLIDPRIAVGDLGQLRSAAALSAPGTSVPGLAASGLDGQSWLLHHPRGSLCLCRRACCLPGSCRGRPSSVAPCSARCAAGSGRSELGHRPAG